MPVYVIDTIKPKNGLDFAVVEAVDVAVEGYLNLADAVTHFATQSALAELTAAINDKADTADLTAATTSLQNQINNLITPVTQDAEVQNARVDADGISHTTLKERLDSDASHWENDIENIESNIESIVSGGTHDPNTNYVDFSTLVADTYIKGGDQGQEASSATSVGMYATDFIELAPNTNYYLGNIPGKNCAFYNKNKEFISGYGTSTGISSPFQIPAGAVYGRFTIVDLSASGNNWLYTSNSRPADYATIPRNLASDIAISEIVTARTDVAEVAHQTLKERLDSDFETLDTKITIESGNLAAEITNVDSKVDSIVSGGGHDPETNYIDFSALTANTYIRGGDQGQEASSATSVGMYATDFIELESNTDYYSGNVAGGNCAFYDANKQYISGYGSGGGRTNPFQIPSGAKYGRFTINDLSVSGNNWIYTEDNRPEDYAELPKTLASDIQVSEEETRRIVALAQTSSVSGSAAGSLKYRNPEFVTRNTPSDAWQTEDCTLTNAVEYDNLSKMDRACVKAVSSAMGACIFRDIQSTNAAVNPLMISIFMPYDEDISTYSGVTVEAFSGGYTNTAHRLRANVVYESATAEEGTYNGKYCHLGWHHFCLNLKSIPTEVGESFDYTAVTRIGLRFFSTSGNPRTICLNELSFVKPMHKGGIITIVDNFNPSVPAMADYAYSKGVRLNLSIVPGYYDGSELAPTCASLEELERMTEQGHCIINHTYQHLNFNELTEGEIKDEIFNAELWMQKNNALWQPSIVSIPSARFNTNSYKAVIDTNADAIFHVWSSTAHARKTYYPFYPCQRCIDTTTLDSTFQENVSDAITAAQKAVEENGIAVIGFHGTYWTLYNSGELWKEYIDAIAEIQGVYHYGIDEIINGQWY